MYKREFDRLLEKRVPSSTLLYGEEEYFFYYYQKYYKDKLEVKSNNLTLYYEEYDFHTAKSYLSQNSLFGDINLLIIRTNKVILKKELDTLISLTEKASNNYLLLIFDGETKTATKLQKSFSKTGQNSKAVWVRFFTLKSGEAMDILQSEAYKLRVKIDISTLNYLFNILNFNLSLSVKEMEKLAIFDEVIKKDDIDKLVYPLSPISIDKFIFELFNKRTFIKTIQKIVESGNSEFEILKAIQIFINRIFLFYSYKQIHKTVSSEKIFGYRLPIDIEG
jgi:DNA polymerase-3 subunit delta